MDNLPNLAQKNLREYVKRLESLAETKAGIAAEMTELLTDAKNEGFDPKIIRKLLSLRKKPRAEREREEALLATYLHAIGQLDGTPLGSYGREQIEAAA